MLGILVAMAMLVASGAAAAEEDVEADVEADADEEVVEEESDEPEGEASEDGEAPEGWETSLRDPISANINHEGSLGFGGIASAISPGEMLFQVGLLAEATRGSDFVRFNDEHRAFAANLLLNASINEHFAAHLQLRARNNVNNFGRPESILTQGDMSMGVTGRAEVNDGVWLGGDLSLYFPSSFDGVGLSPSSTTVRPRLLASFDFDQINGAEADRYVPLVAHLNMGYRIDNTEKLIPDGEELNRVERLGYGISAYDLFELGLGVEVPLPYVTPHVGWQLGIPVRGADGVCDDDRALNCVSDVGGSSYPQRMTIGAKVEPLANLGLHGGMDIGLTSEQAEGLPATYPYQFNFGVSYNLDPSPPVRIEESEVEVEVEAQWGEVLASIIDEETGEPIEGVRVSYVDMERSSQVTGTEGDVRSYQFEPGQEVAVFLEHDHFEDRYVDWTIEEGSHEIEEALVRIPQMATVGGQVMAWSEESESMEPAGGARIIVGASHGLIEELEADEEGRFELDVDAGALSIAAAMEGYLSQAEFVEAEGDGDYRMEFALEAVEQRLAERANGEIGLEATIEFVGRSAELEEESHVVLDHLASVLFEEPEITRLMIQGHTSDQGEPEELDAISEERAEVVKEALIERGVQSDRLDAEGHGSSSPLLPNTSSRNRALNERIEFHIE